MEAQWKYLLGKLRGPELECVPSKTIDKYTEAHRHQRTNIDKLTAEAARKQYIDCGRDIWKREMGRGAERYPTGKRIGTGPVCSVYQ